MITFGDKLRSLRKQYGKSQFDVALELGMSQTALSAWENSRTPPRGTVLEKMADFFCVTPGYFYDSESYGLSDAETRLLNLYRHRDWSALLVFIGHNMRSTEEEL